MKTINTAPLKLELFRAIDKMGEKEIKALHDFVIKTKNKDLFDLLEDWQKEDIDSGLNDIEQGKFMSATLFVKNLG